MRSARPIALVTGASRGLGFALAGPAGVARDNGVKNAAVLVTDVPAASGPVQSVGGAFYKNAGVTLDVVPVPPGTADMTPQVQAALNINALFIIGADLTPPRTSERPIWVCPPKIALANSGFSNMYSSNNCASSCVG